MKNNNKILTIKDINNILNKSYPYQRADNWGNVGFFRKSFKKKKVNKEMLVLDVSIDLIKYANINKTDLLIPILCFVAFITPWISLAISIGKLKESIFSILIFLKI